MSKIVKAVVGGTSRLNWVLGAASAVLGFGLVGVVVYGVLMRYLFRSPTAYSLELPQVLFIAIIAFCLAYTQMQGRHVRVEIITSRLRAQLQDAFSIAASIVTFAYCIAVAWALWQRTAWHFAKGIGTIDTHIPLAPFSLIIVVGIGLLALQVIIEGAGLLAKIRRQDK